MLFHRNAAELLSALDPYAETIEDRTAMVPNSAALEAGTVIPRGRESGALVAYRNGRGVVLYDGELRWDELVESRTGVRILLLDDAGPNKKLHYVDESGNSFSSWLVAQRKARRRKLGHRVTLYPSPSNRLSFRLFLRRICI
ncbi:MAG: hypothetical protein ABSG63_02825 [Spirochaetia bacterium]